MADDDKPKIVRPTPEEIATHGKRVIVYSSPFGSSSWFDEQWRDAHRVAPEGSERVTKTAREWREHGIALPEYIPDGAKLTGVQAFKDGSVTFRNSWAHGWDDDTREPMTVSRHAERMPSYAEILGNVNARDTDLPREPPSYDVTMLDAIRDVQSWDLWDGLDRYWQKLCAAMQVPASMLMPKALDPDEDGYRYRRMISLKHFRMRAKDWLTMRGPLRRFQNPRSDMR